MRAEDIKIGMEVQYANLVYEVLTNAFMGETEDRVMARNKLGAVSSLPIEGLTLPVKIEYAAVYRMNSDNLRVGPWRPFRTNDGQIGYLVRDTSESQIRWEPAE